MATPTLDRLQRIEADKRRWVRGLLISASRYIQEYAQDKHNHPQAIDNALSLLSDIAEFLKSQEDGRV